MSDRPPVDVALVEAEDCLMTLKHLLAEHAGQTAALAAGFRAAHGRVVVTLDADLQNDPADVPALLAELERSRAAAVVGYRVNRHDSAWKRLQSRIANGVRNRLNRETIRDTGCSLKAFRADAVRALPLFDGMHRFLPTLIRMGGGTVVEVPVRHRPLAFLVGAFAALTALPPSRLIAQTPAPDMTSSNVLSAEESAQGFRQLFDGSSTRMTSFPM